MFQCMLAWNILPVWTALYETPGHEAVINLQESFTLHPCARNMMGVIFLLNAEQKNFIIVNSIFGKCMQECRTDYWSYKSSLVMKSEDINNFYVCCKKVINIPRYDQIDAKITISDMKNTATKEEISVINIYVTCLGMHILCSPDVVLISQSLS